MRYGAIWKQTNGSRAGIGACMSAVGVPAWPDYGTTPHSIGTVAFIYTEGVRGVWIVTHSMHGTGKRPDPAGGFVR